MAFVQQKLTLVAQQSVGSLNLYVYEPDNGDASTDILGAGYFAESRFIGEDGWVDSFLFCNLDDGPFIMQIQANGITAAQVGAGGGDIPAIELNISELEKNVRVTSVANMSNSDYTLTDEQSLSAGIVPFLVGTGKTLTFPTSTDGMRPALVLIYGLYATSSYTIKAEGSATTITAQAGQSYLLAVTDTSGVVDFTSILATTARRSSNGVTTSMVAPNQVLVDADAGSLLIGSSGAPQTLTINSGLLTENLVVDVMCTGAGGVTVTAGTGGVTVTGNAVLTTGQSCKVWRNGLTEDYYCS
jgi:hypothetical protein